MILLVLVALFPAGARAAGPETVIQDDAALLYRSDAELRESINRIRELGIWFAELVKPWFLVPLWAFYPVGVAYYVGGATILYRVRVHVADRRARAVSLTLTIGVLFCNELWNYLFFGLRSPLAGFLGIVVFLVPLTALLIMLRLHERFSAKLVVAYYAWVLYDLAWTYQLWRLNGDA